MLINVKRSISRSLVALCTLSLHQERTDNAIHVIIKHSRVSLIFAYNKCRRDGLYQSTVCTRFLKYLYIWDIQSELSDFRFDGNWH